MVAVSLLATTPALATSYGVATWGDNHLGQLGIGTARTKSDVPRAVGTMGDGVVSISSNLWHELALLSDGTVVSWGRSCKLGDTCGTAPEVVSGLSEVAAVSAGVYFNLALLRDGRVMAWGNNDFGELGDGSTISSDVPVEVSGLRDRGVVAISAGYYHSLALLGDGRVMAWGGNNEAQLGVGTSSGPDACLEALPCSTVPVEVEGLEGVTAVSAGWWHSMALLSDGRVMAWGRNAEGQLGIGTSVGPNACQEAAPCSATPQEVDGLGGAAPAVTAISAGAFHSLALLADGVVEAWGRNSEGELGGGTITGSDVPMPVIEPGTVPATAISGGEEHSLALLSDGTVMAWGANGDGQLGDGGTRKADVPVPVSGLTGVSEISAGGHNSVAAVRPRQPTVMVVSARRGPVAGGTSVTITGANLLEAGAVRFGAAAASFTVDSSRSITAVSPPGRRGDVDVTVTTPYGTSAISGRDHFRFTASRP